LPEEETLTIALEIESRLDQVRLIRAAMSGALNHLGVVEADILALELAVTEIVNNAVEHGYAGADDQPIKVRIQLSGSTVQIEVIDHARPFPEKERHRLMGEAGQLDDADEEWSPRGHGLQIVRQIVDSIALESNESRNILRIRKKVALTS
jgi:anti-sigma regulatory factor (Ser/Thr protein kinase)